MAPNDDTTPRSSNVQVLSRRATGAPARVRRYDARVLIGIYFFSVAACGAADRWNPLDYAIGEEAQAKLPAVAVRWEGLPLRRAVERIGSSTGEAVWVDRRVNPSTPVDFQAEGNPVALLGAIAEQLDLGASRLAETFYVGPLDAAQRLRTLHAMAAVKVEELPATVRKRYRGARPLAWQRLADPRSLVVEHLAESGLRLGNPERVPHDLWPAGRLPKAPLEEQLTLLLVGFGLQWRPNAAGTAVLVSPIEQPVSVERNYRPPVGRRTALRRDFLRAAPGAEIRRRDGGWAVTALVEEHEMLAAMLAADRPRRTTNRGSQRPRTGSAQRGSVAAKRFTLAVREQPARAVLKQLSESLGLELVVPPGAAAVDRRVTFEANRVTLQELLDQIGEEAGTAIQWEGQRIVVGAGSGGR